MESMCASRTVVLPVTDAFFLLLAVSVTVAPPAGIRLLDGGEYTLLALTPPRSGVAFHSTAFVGSNELGLKVTVSCACSPTISSWVRLLVTVSVTGKSVIVAVAQLLIELVLQASRIVFCCVSIVAGA